MREGQVGDPTRRQTASKMLGRSGRGDGRRRDASAWRPPGNGTSSALDNAPRLRCSRVSGWTATEDVAQHPAFARGSQGRARRVLLARLLQMLWSGGRTSPKRGR